jgi:hypothetical protein
MILCKHYYCMEELTRHFVTAVLGRGTVKTAVQESGDVSIEVTLSGPPNDQKIVDLVATKDDVAGIGALSVELLFKLSRIAIAQVQAHRGTCIKVGSNKLALECRPWNGDLMERPFGGATIGCARLFEQETSAGADVTR